jgi:outer membrane protein assembly factor BamE (lipoprotein component of BamABCDE complex)
MKQLFAYALLITLLSACAAPVANVRVDDQQLSMIREGQTTEQEVVQMLGRPTTVTVTPQRRTLVYSYTLNNNVEKQVVSTTGTVVGGFVAGPIGSLAGGMLGGVVPNNQMQDQVSIDIDPITYTVINYQRQRTTNY